MLEPFLPKNAGDVGWAGPDSAAYAASGLIHCYRLPDEPDAPLVVMLHGWGGDESVMWIFKQVVPRGVAIITPRAPLALESGGYVWFERDGRPGEPDSGAFQEALDRLEHFLGRLPELYPVDPERMILISFSQGAMLSNSLALSRPGWVRGVASLAGAVPRLPDVAVRAGSLAGLPVFIAHGLEDELVPVDAARRARDMFTRAGAIVSYGEYAVGHKLDPEGMRNLKAWLRDVLQA
jgi:phospholipase/carboxylesterase